MGLRALAGPGTDPAADVSVGSTIITGGTDGRILYDNAGVLGEKATTGAGVVALATGPTFVTPVLGAATATSVNNVVITALATASTLTLLTGGTTNTFVGTVTAGGSTAITAGGNLTGSVQLSSTANFGVFVGSGAPSISAAKGSLYLRSDGSTTNDRAYIATTATGTWTPLTTAG